VGRGIFCSTCKQEKGPGCENDNRCKKCKRDYELARRIKKRLAAGKPERRPPRTAYCDNCKKKQELGLDISGKCTSCVVIGNRLRLHAKREEKGLAPVAIRDSSFCHECNIPKVNGRCIPCRRRMASERKATKRQEAGKREWGSGRPQTCYKCGKIKENTDHAYCIECKSIDDKIRWREVISPKIERQSLIIKQERTGLCPCGNERASYHKSYCKPCLAKLARERRERKNEGRIVKVRAPLTAEEKRIKRHARTLVNSEIRKGFLIPLPCEVCGGNSNIEAHHDDYSKPLHVRWLCVIHHREHHRNNE